MNEKTAYSYVLKCMNCLNETFIEQENISVQEGLSKIMKNLNKLCAKCKKGKLIINSIDYHDK